MAASTKCLNFKKAWPLPDITSFSCMQKIVVTGTSDLASLFYTKGVLYSISIPFVGCFCYNAYWGI